MTILWIDTETYCETDLKSAGLYRYAEQVEVMLLQYAVGDGPVCVVDLTAGETIPPDIVALWSDPNVRIGCHNSMFDRTVINTTGILQVVEPERWVDTMVQAFAHGLPGSLGQLSEIFNLSDSDAKDARGKSLIQLFCKPRPKNSKIRRATRETHPVEWAEFKSYADRDIRAMRKLHHLMPKINYPNNAAEHALWCMDQRMNDYGINIDVRLAHCAVEAANAESVYLKSRAKQLTDNAVSSATRRDMVIDYIFARYGIALDDLRASTVERVLADTDTPPAMRDLLLVRLEASTTSVSKYQRLIKATNTDGRLRGTIQFCGASRTGRDAGRIFQPQNLKRPTMRAGDIDDAIECIYNGSVSLAYAQPMDVLSNAVRGVITAPTGKKLCISDLSNIEGRGGAFLAGESWKLQAFRDFDAGTGADLYKLAYAKSFGVDAKSVTKDQRQIGKVQELALLYAGGVGAFVTFALGYGIDLDSMARDAWDAIPQDAKNKAASMHGWIKSKGMTDHNLKKDTWLVCEAFKALWREAHPNTVELWADLARASCNAIVNEGVTYSAGAHIKFKRQGNWLYARLPSGRCLCYAAPKLESDKTWSYMGMNQYTRKWSRISTHAGKILENMTQAFSRDVLFYNKPAIENAGYKIVLAVHDELLTETPDDSRYSAGELSRLMSVTQPWADGLPLAAAGFETYRYRKD